MSCLLRELIRSAVTEARFTRLNRRVEPQRHIGADNPLHIFRQNDGTVHFRQFIQPHRGIP